MPRRSISSLGLTGSLVLASALACGTGPDEDSVIQLVVRTDKPVYSLATDSAATPTLVNQGNVPLYAPMNEFVYVQRLLNGQWGPPQPWFVVDGIGPSFPVLPGDSLIALEMSFDYVGNRPGTFRFLFEVAFDRNGRRLVPEPLRATPAFELRP